MSDLENLKKEEAELRHQIKQKQEQRNQLAEIKQEKRTLSSLKSELHPSKFQKLKKALGKAERATVAGSQYAYKEYKNYTKVKRHHVKHKPKNKKLKEMS